MFRDRPYAWLCLFFISSTFSLNCATADSDGEIRAIKAEIESLRQNYEIRIADLEAKLKSVESTRISENKKDSTIPIATDSSGRNTYGSIFNPSIGVILNGRFSNFSNDDSEIAGFGVGEEGERGKEGLAVDESEVNVAANVDDKFFAHATAAIVHEEGEDKIELEEAFFQILPGAALPRGLTIKGGRAFWTLGYLNEHHTHADDFADRPLPYRVFLNNVFNDDGIQASYVLPTNFYSELGGGIFRGDDFPFGEAGDNGINAWSGFARIGGDIGEDQNWRLGGSFLGGDTDGRETAEGEVNFVGDTQLYVMDLRYTWAPTGNSKEQELILQSEYMWRNDDGAYEDAVVESGVINFDESSNGLYVQAVYKFLQQWRIGVRYSQLFSPDVPSGLIGSSLDAEGHDPFAYSGMIDWTNSEFSRLRFQYTREELSDGEHDNQFILQYIMSIGAHAAHAY